MNLPAMPEHRAAAVVYLARIASLLKNGKVSPLPVRVFGGLESVRDAMEEMRAGKVSYPRGPSVVGSYLRRCAGQRREDCLESV